MAVRLGRPPFPALQVFYRVITARGERRCLACCVGLWLWCPASCQAGCHTSISLCGAVWLASPAWPTGQAMNRLLAKLSNMPLFLLWGEKVGWCTVCVAGWDAGL